MKLIQESTLNEMAIPLNVAIDKCQELGTQFIEHFHKLFSEGKDSSSFCHHCKEMQGWLNKCRLIKLKTTNRHLTPANLIDWFFTATGSIDKDNGFNTYEEIDAYNEFMLALAANRESKVIDVAKQIIY